MIFWPSLSLNSPTVSVTHTQRLPLDNLEQVFYYLDIANWINWYLATGGFHEPFTVLQITPLP
jgi:hypothetical protein